MSKRVMARDRMDWSNPQLTDAVDAGQLVLLDNVDGVSKELVVTSPEDLAGVDDPPAPVVSGEIPRASMDWRNEAQVEAVERGDLTLTD